MKRAILAASFTAFLLLLTTWLGLAVPDSAGKAGVMAVLLGLSLLAIIGTAAAIAAIED